MPTTVWVRKTFWNHSVADSCGMEVIFWSKDEETIKCMKCGSEYEVEQGEAMLDREFGQVEIEHFPESITGEAAKVVEGELRCSAVHPDPI